jgi:hypothetical protein
MLEPCIYISYSRTDLMMVQSRPLLDFSRILLFIGAMGKLGQLGLHAWLPDAHGVKLFSCEGSMRPALPMLFSCEGSMRPALPMLFSCEGSMRPPLPMHWQRYSRCYRLHQNVTASSAIFSTFHKLKAM